MVTVHKAHFVVDLKMALIAMLPDDNKPDVKDVVLTEVYHWSIARILVRAVRTLLMYIEWF